MSATQISFALAQRAAMAPESTPPVGPALVLKLDGGSVARPVADGGECPEWAGPSASRAELLDGALATCDSHRGCLSAGAFVLLELHNLRGFMDGLLESNSGFVASYDRLCAHAARCIGAGC
jgi:hypothetical protein